MFLGETHDQHDKVLVLPPSLCAGFQQPDRKCQCECRYTPTCMQVTTQRVRHMYNPKPVCPKVIMFIHGCQLYHMTFPLDIERNMASYHVYVHSF